MAKPTETKQETETSPQQQTLRERQEQSLRERETRDAERLQMQHGRNAHMQEAPEGYIEPKQIDDLIKQEYSHLDQPGLHPANMPGKDSYAFKTTRDLEDITGNPGHRSVNPNAPATSINRTMPDARDNPASINEPPDVRQAPASINEPPGSNVRPPEQQEDDKEKRANEAREKAEDKKKADDARRKEDRDEYKKHK